MTRQVRVGAVSYLNARPLIEELDRYVPPWQLILDVPSRLADAMAAGTLDIGLIPVVEFLRAPDYTFIPGIAIASRGPVLSVTLFSRVKWPHIRRVALDEGSRTSAVLVRVLLQERWGVEAEYQPLPLHHTVEDVEADAVLLIGDRAMHACLPGWPYAYDLGTEWTDWTGLPMVYALWAVRPEIPLEDVAEPFLQARQRGLSRLGLIAQREAARLHLDAGYCRRYLSHIIRYDLGAWELAGLRRFAELTAQLGLTPPLEERRLQTSLPALAFAGAAP
ncbi:MAG: menaquinone biosynthesis protein [Thermogemmata sp.]|jgi:chorismate dehydratase|uniref:Chorismate dehydratase n=1 Tax=Thermogemmata fonticola TaxID=2755323 RepID=A0A7V8VFL2_9BACT|nr:menaquinone biosynthesis protein [Thermogemmata fonticola]MBA2227143.1 menaquinone biosynthesis protein [Thermogemmata fonticola]